MYLHQLLILLFNIILLIAAIVLMIPIATVLLECLSASFFTSSNKDQTLIANSHRPRVAVLVPAHNEATGIEKVLLNLLPQILEQDKLIVIADNCTDNTAEIARNCGAIVIERNDSQLRGKGYALDYGLKYMESEPPEAVVMIDADCLVEENLIDKIARLAIASGKPIQALYLLEQPASEKITSSVSTLAFTVKNLVRPMGLKKLGFPALLTGTGMAFSWSVIQEVSLASDNIVEDMQLSLDLAIAGHSTIFYPDVKLVGVLPEQESATKSQRTRWEHGHLKTLLTQVPRLIKAAVSQKRLDLLALSLDLSVPPLSLLVIFWFTATAFGILNILLGSSWLLTTTIFAVEGLAIFGLIFLVSTKFGSKDILVKLLIAMPMYILWKIPIYMAFLLKPQNKWIRTERK